MNRPETVALVAPGPCPSLAGRLQHIEPALATVLRRCCGRTLRGSLPAARPIDFECRFGPVPQVCGEIELGVQLGGANVVLQLAGPGLSALRSLLDEDLSPAWRVAAFLAAAAPWWEALQQWLPVTLELRAVASASNRPPCASLDATLQWGPGERVYFRWFAASPADAAALADLCTVWALDEPPVAVAALHTAVVERVPLAWRDLRLLACGDLVLLQATACASGTRAMVAFDGVLLPTLHALCVGTGRWTVGRQVFESDTRQDRSEPMPRQSDGPNEQLDEARVALPRAELRMLAPGQVIETDTALPSPQVLLWCGGQRIGRGELVVVGERLAVRVVALGAPANAAPYAVEQAAE